MEFALVLPLALLMTLGVVDGARIFTSWVSLTGAVREAALYASSDSHSTDWCSPTPSGASVACPAGTTSEYKRPDPDNMAYRMAQEANGLDLARITFQQPICKASDGTPVACGTSTVASVTIRASYTMNLVVPVIGSYFGNPVTLWAATTMPVLR